MAKIRFTNFDGLLNTGVSDFLLEDNELRACKNVWSQQIGKIEKVPGYSKATTEQVVQDKNVNYLHHYYRPSTKTDYMLAGSDSGSDYKLMYRTTGGFANVTTGTFSSRAGAEIDIANYLDKAFIVGYDSGTFLTNATIDGTTMSTADTDLTDMPQGKYIVRYRDLLYVLHCYEDSTLYPSRAYFCDEPTAGAISWTTATRFIEFGYDDGDEITGGAEASDRLIVFKRYSMWKYDEVERKKIADIGCDSNKSIVKMDNVLYWFNRTGIFRWAGTTPQLISRKVQKFINAIDQTKVGEVVAGIYNDFEYRVFIGDVTVDGLSYDNTWLCFDTNTEKWYIRCTKDYAYSACNFVEAGKRRLYFGSEDGYVMKFANKVDEVYADDGEEIDSFAATKYYDYGQPETIKRTNNITVFSRNNQALKITCAKDNNDEYKQDYTTTLRRKIDNQEINHDSYRTSFLFYEKGKGKSWELEGIVIDTIIKEEPS